jgi:hypothetical protein
MAMPWPNSSKLQAASPQIILFGAAPPITGTACHNVPNGGYFALAADRPQSPSVIGTLARRVPYRRIRALAN